MEYLGIVVILEIFAAIITFVGNDMAIEGKLFLFLLIGGLGVLIVSMRLHDQLITFVLKKKNFKKAIRLYHVKLRMTPSSRSRNGILINIAPLHFMLDEVEEAKNILDKIDLLTLKQKILKGYHQLLHSYYFYVKDNFVKSKSYTEASINYDPLFTAGADLIRAAIFLKEDNKKEAVKLFAKIPNELDEYIEPFDRLFLEVQSKIKG